MPRVYARGRRVYTQVCTWVQRRCMCKQFCTHGYKGTYPNFPRYHFGAPLAWRLLHLGYKRFRYSRTLGGGLRAQLTNFSIKNRTLELIYE